MDTNHNHKNPRIEKWDYTIAFVLLGPWIQTSFLRNRKFHRSEKTNQIQNLEKGHSRPFHCVEKSYLYKDLEEDFNLDIKRYRVKLLKHPLVIELLEGKGRKLLKGILLSKSGAYSIEEKCAIVERDDLNLVDPRGSYLYRTLSKHPNFQIRLSLAGRDDLLVVDPSGEVINNLKNDEKGVVRNALKYNPMNYLKESTRFLIDLLRG